MLAWKTFPITFIVFIYRHQALPQKVFYFLELKVRFLKISKFRIKSMKYNPRIKCGPFSLPAAYLIDLSVSVH